MTATEQMLQAEVDRWKEESDGIIKAAEEKFPEDIRLDMIALELTMSLQNSQAREAAIIFSPRNSKLSIWKITLWSLLIVILLILFLT